MDDLDPMPPDLFEFDGDVVVAGRAWMPKDPIPPEHLQALREANRVKLEATSQYDDVEWVRCHAERGGWIGLPRPYYRRTRSPEGQWGADWRVADAPLGLDPAVGPRDDLQRRALGDLVDHLGGTPAAEGILQLATGAGKTVVALLAAAELDAKLLVVVHTSHLLEQWRERVLDDPPVFPGAEVGIVRGDTCELDGADVAVATYQTLANRPPEHPAFGWGGMAVFDEVHLTGASTFNEVVHKCRQRRRFGLTATPRRSDGGETAFHRGVGRIVHRGGGPTLEPKVRWVETGWTPGGSYPPWIEKRKMIRDAGRNATIADEVHMARLHGRQVLVLTRRVEHVLRLKACLEGRDGVGELGLCVGSWYVDEAEALDYSRDWWAWREQFRDDDGWSEARIDPDGDNAFDPEVHVVERDDDGSIKKVKPRRRSWPRERFEAAKAEADVLLATYGAVECGFDVPRLDNVHLAMPTGDPEQAVGRILREADKPDPAVTDYVDATAKSRGKARKRRRTYRKLGADV